ncbi:TIGR02391 family protein [Rhodococcus sp. IEGM1428]|uniref:TIGR02391 family protein n=1 Tax=Rhodococcus sp. IEGM1428 TaxID=3392191 RepID=UPI003D0DE014
MAATARYAESAIYALELGLEIDEPLDESSFDSELWAHVRALVEDGDWGKVATQAAVFTEDKVRRWSAQGSDAVGKGLFGQALADAGPLRLGAMRGEWEGWRALGTGFVQAAGNVDRHHVQHRSDLQRYAVGVLGLASLLLTQMRHEHPELIEQQESLSRTDRSRHG